MRAVEDGLDELPSFAVEPGQQGFGFEQVLEAVFGEVGVARSDDAAQLQLHQQGLQRQLADIALLGQGIEQQLPLTVLAVRQQFVEHAADAAQLGRIAIDEVFQHVEAVAVGQHQAV
ncbi:hypothetical protein D3C85_900940 [compost metagenome]